MKRLLLLIAWCAFAAPVAAPADPLPDMERILLPITVMDHPGAYGTRWSSRLQIDLDVNPVPADGVIPFTHADCDIFGPCEPLIRRGPLYLNAVLTTGPGDTDGQYLYIQRTIAGRASLSLKLTATAGGDSSADLVDIPVAREHDFRDTSFSIMDVPPPSADRRLALRIYGHDPNPGGLVRVTVFEGYPEKLLRDDVCSLSVRQVYLTNVRYSLPLRPPVAEAFYDAPFDASDATLRFQITPLTPGLLVWSFVSATSNRTQHVEIFAPH